MTELTKADFKNNEFIQPKGSVIGLAVAILLKLILPRALAAFIAVELYSLSPTYEVYYQVTFYLYLGLTEDPCVYPSQAKEISGDQGKSILSTFAILPKIKDGGFWNLTAYGPDQDPIENDLSQYYLGDRDTLTFLESSLVSNGKGSFQILLQATDI
ncbi:unnamed protein product [Clonostachys chloroleuca]|uniref:Uncharacterized protein n=1 Tax=Clonostachys chloroleuca TaxID=1926264 RepID=A0AA35MJU0_9HYPO|nr:unnamed protein product [Clonostachys chloroleuca]